MTFTCSHGGRDARGAVAADTYIYPSPARGLGSFWAVDFLAGWIAPPDSTAAATAMLTHMVRTLRIDPVWQPRMPRFASLPPNPAPARPRSGDRLPSLRFHRDRHPVARLIRQMTVDSPADQ